MFFLELNTTNIVVENCAIFGFSTIRLYSRGGRQTITLDVVNWVHGMPRNC